MSKTPFRTVKALQGALIALGIVTLSAPWAVAGEQPSQQQGAEQQGARQQSVSDHIVAQKEVGEGLYELVFSPSQQAIYVAAAQGFGEGASDNYGEADGGSIFKLDPQTLEIQKTIKLDQKPFGLALNEKTHTLFVGHTLDQSVTAINLDDNSTRHLALATDAEKAEAKKNDVFGPNPRQLHIDEQSNTLYVTGVGDKSVLWVINGEDLTLTDTIEGFGVWATGLAVDHDNKRLYVSTMKDNAVRVVDMDSHKIIAQWPTGGDGPLNLALDGEKHQLYVTNSNSGDVTVLDTENGEVVDTLKSGDGTLALMLEGDRLYVTNRKAKTVTLFDRDSHELIDTIKTPLMPNSLAAISDASGAYVSLKQELDENHQTDKLDSVIRIKP
ncbi:40-residue YVTN family beta-propeller repeat-containing protein [Kushneria avicenniae]|uniref:40-residue YVTN family beta-propeller repeat-containing protein n=1 Tax=Kushneria avicenniae TaxID=402385 RepID=A0A1I1KTX0_9GAMM|nr:YncE family protein [Kushneria avicenniae]SFC64264.1 40-residue YVTN family beta-propeller repeat-containing protein [Kushneria avicenniae]